MTAAMEAEPGGAGPRSGDSAAAAGAWGAALTAGERVLGAVLVVAGVALQAGVMGRAAIGLTAGLVLAYLVWAFVPSWRGSPRVQALYLLGIAVQCLHLLEEYLTGFQRALPGLFGYAWSDQRFLAFNLVWLCVFVLAAAGIAHGLRLAYLVAIFFALVGEVGNAGLHVVMAVGRGGYAPGLASAVVHGVVGLALLHALFGRAPAVRAAAVTPWPGAGGLN